MLPNTLSKISTQWSEMEEISQEEGPTALANYLAVTYFNVLASKFKRYHSQMDDLQAYEMASDVLYDLIKNDYRGINRLSRDRGHLRGLFFRIIKSKLSLLKTAKKHKLLEEFEEEGQETEIWANFYLDLDEALNRLEKERPKLHLPFVSFYLEGKNLHEVAELMGLNVNAIKQRLHSARRCLAELLEDYQQ